MGLPVLSLTLEALGPNGHVLTAEQKVATQLSLPLKQKQAALNELALWGKITTVNGKDYMIAEGCNKVLRKIYCYSQDCVKWLDLEPISQQVASKAALFTLHLLSGEPSKVYTHEEPVKQPEQKVDEEAAEPAPPVVHEVNELQRLRFTIDSVTEVAGAVPCGSYEEDANGHFVPNKLFAGLAYADKLESYVHYKSLMAKEYATQQILSPRQMSSDLIL